MGIEIINTGSELMIGRVLNTHSQWLCAQLDSLGYTVSRQVTVNDDGTSIVNAVKEALSRSEMVLVTGGLGPTTDDLTRPLIARLFGRRLLTDGSTLERIRGFFAKRGTAVPFHCEIQAQYPEGALIIPNDYGTAPGLLIELEQNPFRSKIGKAVLILLPGPPRELRPMFTERVIPLLREKMPPAENYVSLTLKTACTGESTIERQVAPALEELVRQGLEIGYCARVGEVELRLSAHGSQAQQIVDQAEIISRAALGEIIFGTGSDKLEQTVVRLLSERHQTLSTAESCTGGFIAHRITNVPGASEIFMGSCVTYSNKAKINLLGVRPETLNQYGAVSEQTACEMAEGLRRRMNTDYAVSATGIAGPGGGTPEKPVGTVYIGLSTAQKTEARKQVYNYDREAFKTAVSQFALDWIRRTILTLPQ